MARSIKAKALAVIATAVALSAAAPAAMAATVDTITVADLTATAATSITNLLTTETPATEAPAPAVEAVEAPAPLETVPATATEDAAPTAEAVAAGPIVIDVNCTGDQASIDTCVGATNYTPVANYLGVPYYAQHNGMGGEAWLSLTVGDQVIADGQLYTITEVRTVSTGGDIDQIAGMNANAYLQTCLDDNIHSNVYALTTA